MSPEQRAVVEAAKAYYESSGDVDNHNDLMDAVSDLITAEQRAAATKAAEDQRLSA